MKATDAYDLWWYWTTVLSADDRKHLPRLIQRKLASSRLPDDTEVLTRFDAMRENAQDEWASGKGLVITGTKPAWAEIDKALTRVKSICPHNAR